MPTLSTYTHIPVIRTPDTAEAITRTGEFTDEPFAGCEMVTLGAAILIVFVVVELAPRLSVTLATTVYIPADL
jgi:hypothetical protein